MSEVEKIEPIERYKSFAEKVYVTLNAFNVEPHIQQKGKLDYLPWAPAWNMLMTAFPESDFEFDEPKMFNGTGGEQWITVNVREGDNVLTRRWWLPYLDFKNQPVAAPTSLQINNTRMRVLVKCLAMCGLGVELYAGEDVPTEKPDAKVQGSRVVDMALDDVNVDWEIAGGHVSTVKAAIFNEDDPGLLAEMERLATEHDLKLAVWSKLSSKERSYIKKVTKEQAEKSES